MGSFTMTVIISEVSGKICGYDIPLLKVFTFREESDEQNQVQRRM
jgi:hypothetical protein